MFVSRFPIPRRRVRIGAIVTSIAVASFVVAPARAETGIPASGSNTSALATMQKLSLGWNSSCVLRNEGHMVCWGRDYNAGLGTGWRQSNVGTAASEMGGNLRRTLATDANGVPVRTKAIFAGGDITCALGIDDKLRCAGANVDGGLGRNDGLSTSSYATALLDSSVVNVGTGRKVVDLATGGDDGTGSNYRFNCALLDNGQVKCWGNNTSGQLGIGTIASPNDKIGDAANEMGDNLQPVALGTGVTATAVTAGVAFACAIVGGGDVPAGSVKCWGDNGSGQLGLGDAVKRGDSAATSGDNLPTVNIGTGRTAKAIMAGGYHVCVIRDNDTLVCWGSNLSGNTGRDTAVAAPNDKIGNGANEMGDNLIAVNLGAGAKPVQISAGGGGTCALLDDNVSVKCWGYGAQGTLGYGDTSNRGTNVVTVASSPAIDLGLDAGEQIVSLRSGAYHNCILTSTARVKCWGRNSSGFSAQGMLGIGDVTAPKDLIGNDAGEMGTSLAAVNYEANTPAEAQSVSMTSLGTSVTLSWSTPLADNGMVTGYEYVCNRNGSLNSSDRIATNQTSVTFTQSKEFGSMVNLTSGITLRCWLRAQSANGAGVEVAYSVVVGTPVTVTASSHTIDVGSAVPTVTGTPSVSGVARTGETCTTTYTSSSAVGTYPTTCSGGSAPGYVVSYAAGVITVLHPAPTVASVSPSDGPSAGGTTITITGTGFRSGATVDTGGAACTSVTVVSATSITCTTPARSGGGSDVVVTNSDGRSGTLSNGFTFVTPTTTSTTTTTTVPASNSQMVTAAFTAPSLITEETKTRFEADPGEAVAYVNGKKVAVDIVTTPENPTPEQSLQVARSIVATLESLTPDGKTNPVKVFNSTSGPELTGLLVNPEDPTEKLNVPVDSVKLLKVGSDSAVLISALNQTNLASTTDASGALEVTRNGVLSARAYGLGASELGEIILMSTPRLLTTFTVDKSGSYAGQVPLPKGIPFGSHTVVMATKNAKVSLGIKLVRTRLQFRVKRTISTKLFRQRAGVKKSGGKVTIKGSGKCRATATKVTMAKRPGSCYITVRQAATPTRKAVYYRFTVMVVNKNPRKIPKKK